MVDDFWGCLVVAIVEISQSVRNPTRFLLSIDHERTSMNIVQDSEHSDGAPTIEGTGIRGKDVAVAYEHSGYEPDEITQLYPDLSLGDVHRALAYYYDNIDDFRSAEPTTV